MDPSPRLLSTDEVDDLDTPLPEDFQPFDPHQVSCIYHRNLPHWRQPDATYFVTFRLADSIPKEQWEHLQAMAELWKRELSHNDDGEPGDHQQEEYAIFQRRYQGRVEKMLDECHGECLLRDPVHRADVVRSLLFFDERHEGAQKRGDLRYRIDAATILPNHVHLAIRPAPGFVLERLLGGMKSASAQRINRRLGREGQLWMEESFDRIVRGEEHYGEVVRYILDNPAKAKLRQGDFWWMAPEIIV